MVLKLQGAQGPPATSNGSLLEHSASPRTVPTARNGVVGQSCLLAYSVSYASSLNGTVATATKKSDSGLPNSFCCCCFPSHG